MSEESPPFQRFSLIQGLWEIFFHLWQYNRQILLYAIKFPQRNCHVSGATADSYCSIWTSAYLSNFSILMKLGRNVHPPLYDEPNAWFHQHTYSNMSGPVPTHLIFRAIHSFNFPNPKDVPNPQDVPAGSRTPAGWAEREPVSKATMSPPQGLHCDLTSLWADGHFLLPFRIVMGVSLVSQWILTSYQPPRVTSEWTLPKVNTFEHPLYEAPTQVNTSEHPIYEAHT